MSSTPLVSIITCVKNNQKFLQQCLDSVVSQSYNNIEHLIIDGYSTDNSKRIIQKYVLQHPSKNIKVYSLPPHGIANALNFGIRHSHGKYIHIVHADDYYYSKDSVQKAVDMFHSNPGTVWLLGDHLLDFSGKVITLHNSTFTHKFGRKLIWLLPWMSHQNMFYDASIYKNNGMYDETYKNSLDYGQWLRLIRRVPLKIVDEKFSVFRVHTRSTTFNPLHYPRLIAENIRAVVTNL
jgi:glycosyltransferase involved in cell wall biosynthesis